MISLWDIPGLLAVPAVLVLALYALVSLALTLLLWSTTSAVAAAIMRTPAVIGPIGPTPPHLRAMSVALMPLCTGVVVLFAMILSHGHVALLFLAAVVVFPGAHCGLDQALRSSHVDPARRPIQTNWSRDWFPACCLFQYRA